MADQEETTVHLRMVAAVDMVETPVLTAMD